MARAPFVSCNYPHLRRTSTLLYFALLYYKIQVVPGGRCVLCIMFMYCVKCLCSWTGNIAIHALTMYCLIHSWTNWPCNTARLCVINKTEPLQCVRCQTIADPMTSKILPTEGKSFPRFGFLGKPVSHLLETVTPTSIKHHFWGLQVCLHLQTDRW